MDLDSQRFRVEQELDEQNLTLEDMQLFFTIRGFCICEFTDPLICHPKSIRILQSLTDIHAQSGEKM